MIRTAFRNWNRDKSPQLAAALAFYSIFSVAPLLILAVFISSMVFDPKMVRSEVIELIGDLAGQDVMQRRIAP